MKYASKNLEKAIKLFARKEAIFLFFLMVLLIVSMLRGGVQAGEDPYYHSRIAEQILKGKLFYDDLSYGGRFIFPTMGLGLIVAAAGLITTVSIKIISLVLPILFGLGVFLLLYYMLGRLNKLILLLIFLFLLISPSFLYLFTRLSIYSAAIFFILLSIYFLSRNYYKAGIAAFIGTFFISFSSGITALFVLLVYCIYIKNLRLWIKFLVAGVIFSLALIPFLFVAGLPELQEFSIGGEGLNFIFQRYFFDFGSKFGLAIFAFLLSFFGISGFLRDKQGHLVVYLGLVGLLVLAYFFDAALFLFAFSISILAAYGFVDLLKKRWQNRAIKYIMLMVFAYGLLFSGISYINQFANEKPDRDIIEGLNYLRGMEDGTVFSYYSNGVWINSIAKKKNVMDSNVFYAPGLNYRWQDSQRIFYSIDIEEISWLFNKYNIKYVFLEPEMRDKIFDKRDIGLLYVLKYSDKFKRLYNKNGVEVWEYAG